MHSVDYTHSIQLARFVSGNPNLSYSIVQETCTKAPATIQGDHIALIDTPHMTQELADMLMLHEAAHNMFSPKTQEELSFAVMASCFNYVMITEDFRIEKLLYRKLPGVRQKLETGYEHLMKIGVFDAVLSNLENASFAGKVMIYTKCGHLIDVPFTDDEKQTLDMLKQIETFDNTRQFASFMMAEMD